MNTFKLPSIIKETSNGYFSFSLFDEMLSKRKIFCMDEINKETVSSLILQLKYLESMDPNEPIIMYINSPG